MSKLECKICYRPYTNRGSYTSHVLLCQYKAKSNQFQQKEVKEGKEGKVGKGGQEKEGCRSQEDQEGTS